LETKEYFEFWNISIWIQLCTIWIHVRHSPTHTQVLVAKGYRRLLRVRVDTDTRFKLYDDECDRTPVYTTRARHTDSPSERRILNYGDKKMLRFFETIMYCINTCTALTRYLYVYVWIQIHVLAIR
jgi:hypothetical protein